ncbi:hypothetical protein [Novosphingobium sp.]|uniref:hypothetical protein n=1 Tax=Novosphingobium sp. TaxID=1874826 RepID=UPI00286A0D6E|nr:hypothetical protein [Novosphingobium sp.]
MKHFRTLALPAALAASAIIAAPALARTAISPSQADSILNNSCNIARMNAEDAAVRNGEPRNTYTLMARSYLTSEMPLDQVERMQRDAYNQGARGNSSQQAIAELMVCVLDIKLTYAT